MVGLGRLKEAWTWAAAAGFYAACSQQKSACRRLSFHVNLRLAEAEARRSDGGRRIFLEGCATKVQRFGMQVAVAQPNRAFADDCDHHFTYG